MELLVGMKNEGNVLFFVVLLFVIFNFESFIFIRFYLIIHW